MTADYIPLFLLDPAYTRTHMQEQPVVPSSNSRPKDSGLKAQNFAKDFFIKKK